MDEIEDMNDLLSKNAQMNNSKIRKSKLKLRILAVCLVLMFFLISSFVVVAMFAENVYIYTGVEGPSMKPTINADAPNDSEPYDYAYVNTYQQGTYGDIIVVKHTSSSGVTKYVIKRLIAMAGDTVKIDNTDPFKTKVYVNDVLLEEDYLASTNQKFRGIGNSLNSEAGITEITIKEGYIFYMGDNRNNSEDCRNYSYLDEPYCEKVENIVGRVDYIVPHDQVEFGDGKDAERFWNGMKEIINRIF